MPPRCPSSRLEAGADGRRRRSAGPCGEANDDAACVGVIAWMHTFSPAKMWIAGLDALRKPLLHLHTQANAALPWATIDMDFMNLNQAAHGDREFGFVQTRLRVARKTVAGHVSDPGRAHARIGVGARGAGAAELRPLRLARFGDNMRDVAVTEGDKVEARAALRCLGQHLRRQRPRGRRRRRPRHRRRRAGRRVRRALRDGRRPPSRRRPPRQRALRRPDRGRACAPS